MANKIVTTSLLTLFFLSCVSCSSNTTKSESEKPSIEENGSKFLSTIVFYNGDLNNPDNNMKTYELQLNTNSVNLTYYFSSPNISCEFSKEKGDEFFNKFQTYTMTEYKPYHANEDGVMVKKYEPFTVQTFYSLKTKDNRYTAEQTADPSGHFYAFNEINYNKLLNDFKELERIAIKSQQNYVETTTDYYNYYNFYES